MTQSNQDPNAPNESEHRSDASPLPEESSETLDSVPDFEQETARLDPKTQRKMDSMEDDATRPGAGQTSSIASGYRELAPHQSGPLETPDVVARQAQTPPADGLEGTTPSHHHQAHRGEASDGVADDLQETQPKKPPGLATTTQDDLLPVAYYYRVAAVLPPVILAMADQVMQTVGLPSIQDNLSIYGLQLQAAFLAENIHRVSHIIDQWARHYLPLNAQLLGVNSEVWGTQHYVTGWRIGQATDWHQAQNNLTTRLVSLTVPAPETIASFRPFIMLQEKVSAEVFPHLVAELHKRFQPQEFVISAVALLRKPRPEFYGRVPEERRIWSVFNQYPLSGG